MNINTTESVMPEIEWNIGYLDREYARDRGDPVLAVIKARTKSEAEQKAAKQGIGGVHGVWAWKKSC